MKNIKLTVIMLCRNDARMLGNCIDAAKRYAEENDISTEYIVVDMGGSDDSVKIAKSKGAKVIQVGKKKLGTAIAYGLNHSRGRYVILSTCDGRFDFYHINGFVKGLDIGYDMIVGNRFAGRMSKGSMGKFEKSFMMPVLAFLFRLRYNTHINDHLCEFIAFRRNKVQVEKLRCKDRKIIAELIAQFLKNGYHVSEAPVNYHKVKK